MKHIRTNGLDLAVSESGSGEPLILIHGSNSDRRQYDIFRPLLGEGIRAIAYDQRDSPDSPCPDVPYTAADHAADLAGLIHGLGLERAHIMGASYGGIIAMTAAIHYPHVVKSLILGATAASHDQFQARDMSAMREAGPEVVERYMLEAVISPDAFDTDPELVTATRSALVIREPASFTRRMDAVKDHDVRNRLAEIQAPTLVLNGDEDPLVPISTAEWIAGKIPQAELHILKGSRHGITLQYRERTAALIRDFVLRHAGS